jgi:hypothetical protein
VRCKVVHVWCTDWGVGAGAYLLPLGLKLQVLMGPKWPLTFPNSSA